MNNEYGQVILFAIAVHKNVSILTFEMFKRSGFACRDLENASN